MHHSSAACRVVRVAGAVVSHSSRFVLHLNTDHGLLAESWLIRLTGRRVNLGGGPEVEFDVGLPGKAQRTPALRVLKTPRSGAGSEAILELVTG